MDLESISWASECAGLLFGFERGSDTVAVAAGGMWESHLVAIPKCGGKGVRICLRLSSLSMVGDLRSTTKAEYTCFLISGEA